MERNYYFHFLESWYNVFIFFKSGILWSNITLLWPSRILSELCFHNCKHELKLFLDAGQGLNQVCNQHSYCKWGVGSRNKMTYTLGLQLCKKKSVLEENNGIKMKAVASYVGAIMDDSCCFMFL